MAAAYIAWMILFRKDKSVLVLATKLGTAVNVVRKVKSILKNVPPWMMITKTIADNRNSVELDNGSWVKASSTSSDAGRSEALSLLVIDEAAHVENMDEIWGAIFPTLSAGGKCIAISTPFGSDSWFYDTYTKAEAGRNDFHPIKLPWDSHPERDQKWFEKETRNMSPRQIASEILCDFAMSGETLLQAADMQFIGKLVKDPKFKSGLDANLWVWEMPISAAKYFLIADVARGDGTDFSVFHVFKTETMEQVAEYQGKIPGDQFSKLITSTAKDYNAAMIVVENNSYGYSVLEKLIEARVPNLYYSMKGSHEYVDAYRAEGAENVVPGFSTTNQTRPMVVAKLEEYIRNRMLLIYSTRAYNELKTFIWKNGKAQASKNKNDDLVISAAIACFVRDTALNANKLDIEYQKAILNSHKFVATPFYTTIPGQVNMAMRDSFGNSVVDKRDYLQADGSKAAPQTSRNIIMPLPIYRG